MVCIQTLERLWIIFLIRLSVDQVWWCSLSVVVIMLHERYPPLCAIFPEQIF